MNGASAKPQFGAHVTGEMITLTARQVGLKGELEAMVNIQVERFVTS